MLAKKFRAPDDLFSKRPSGQLSSAHFQVKIFQNNLEHNRFGATVGLKVDKRSVKRHFWKRFILNRLLRKPNFGKDFIIYAKTGLNKVHKKDAGKELDKIFSALDYKK